jgi:hypothetical protein
MLDYVCLGFVTLQYTAVACLQYKNLIDSVSFPGKSSRRDKTLWCEKLYSFLHSISFIRKEKNSVIYSIIQSCNKARKYASLDSYGTYTTAL